jgi:SAM-dependent methyltransferase
VADPVTIPTNLAPGAFVGTADAYATYRPPYPATLLDDLLSRAGVGHAALLDLASGPGRIALDLAARFDRVLAVDLEPEMIAVARRRARQRGIANVEWRVGRAEDLALEPGSYDLITIGEAWHRLEQAIVAASAFRWLRPGACLVTLGTDGRFTGDTAWETALRDVRARWLAVAFPDGWGEALPASSAEQEGREATMRAAGFADIEGHEYVESRDLTADEVLGYLSSTSVCSRHSLGGGFDAFASELRDALVAAAERDGTPAHRETIRWGYTLARKPA